MAANAFRERAAGMRDLYTERLGPDAVAAHLNVANPFPNAAGKVNPGASGMLAREEEGQPVLQSMTWGLPLRLKTMAPTSKPKAVNNIAELHKPGGGVDNMRARSILVLSPRTADMRVHHEEPGYRDIAQAGESGGSDQPGLP